MSRSPPTDNVLDDVGVHRIRAKTKAQFARFEAEQEGANHLIELLEEELNLKSSYDAQEGILVLTGTDSLKLIAFGRHAAALDRMSRITGLSPKAVTQQSSRVTKQLVDACKDGGHLVMKDKDDKLLNKWETFAEFEAYVERQMEIRGETEPEAR